MEKETKIENMTNYKYKAKYSIMKTIHIMKNISLILFLFIACTGGSPHQQTKVADHIKEPNKTQPDDKNTHIILTRDQLKNIDLQLGKLSKINISEHIEATGALGLPPDAYASVSTKIDGFISGTQRYVEGSRIKKNAFIAKIINPILIEKQEQLLSSHTQLNYLRKEYQRQKSLLEANAGVSKQVEKIYAEMEMYRAKKIATENYLTYLGIDIQKVLEGKFTKEIAIVSPMSGYITSINMHNGMYVKPEQQLLEIINDDHLHLELNVYEKDISLVRIGQKITYTVPALKNKIFEGEIHVLGKEIDPVKKTVRVHGHLKKDRPNFIKDLFVQAKIWLQDQIVTAVPQEALMREGDAYYIYRYIKNATDDESIIFEKIQVRTGAKSDGYIAIQSERELQHDAQFVFRGAYYLHAQSKLVSSDEVEE